MQFFTQGKTNWKYVLIVLILAILVGGGILGYLRYFEKETFFLTKPPEIKKPEKVVQKEELCFKGTMEGPIMKEITDESLRTLILRVAIEKTVEYGYGKEEICKIQRYILETPLGLGGKVDLNGDETPEFIISISCFYIADEPHCIGGGGGTAIFVFGFIQREWKLIGELWGTSAMALKTRHTNGYFNLVTHSPSGACCGEFNEYSWDGEKYELIKTMRYDREKGYDDVESEIWNAYYEQIGG